MEKSIITDDGRFSVKTLIHANNFLPLFLQSLSENQGQTKDKKSRKKGAQTENVAAKVFARYDVVETSYHFYSDRIDLHLCDDPGGSKL